MTLIHATCVAIWGRGLVLRGPSGVGKSDLALRLIAQGAMLVGDDQLELRREGTRVFASAPAKIAGLLEVRGIGLMRQPFALEAPVELLVDLGPPAPERMPEPSWVELEGVQIQALRVSALEPSSPDKILAALAGISRS